MGPGKRAQAPLAPLPLPPALGTLGGAAGED